MARQRDENDNGSWPYVEELFAQGDPLFVQEIRRITDAERLGAFAARWYADQRPEARRLLAHYLARPLNAFRHEVLVKRLFKLAEAAGDDEMMARFLALFDRSLRRILQDSHQSASELVKDRTEADERVAHWRRLGFDAYSWANWERDTRGRMTQRGLRVTRSWPIIAMRVPQGTTMWRPTDRAAKRPCPIDEPLRQKFERHRLFSLKTRRYLRRRAWRYFRKLAAERPERYVPAVVTALRCYRDEDVANGVALLDNWGLVHILFHESPILVARPVGWSLAPNAGLSALTPAPFAIRLWKAEPRTLLDLLREARCRTVRQWAVHLVRRDHAALLDGLSHEDLFELLAHHDPVVVELGIELIGSLTDLSVLGVDRLLELVENPHPETLPLLCELLTARLGPDSVTFAQAVELAASRPVPSARLGFHWLQAKEPSLETDCQALLGLAEAQADAVRGELVRWAITRLRESPHFRSEWVLEFLDSRHREVREEGWAWRQEDERIRDDVAVWRKLFESPHDDVRLRLVAELEQRTQGRTNGRSWEGERLDEDLLRFVWAAVLLNIHRGGRTKPVVVGQLVRRLERRPEEARALLPILAAALRSVRGPEWRAGLAGVVALAERKPDLRSSIEGLFPELRLDVSQV